MTGWSRSLIHPLTVFLVLLGTQARGDFAYDLVSLGVLGGGSLSRATGINGGGQVTGDADTNQGYLRAFYWGGSNQSLQDLGTLDGGVMSQGKAINGQGQVAGSSRVRVGSVNETHAFRTEGADHAPVDLGVLSSAHPFSTANAFADDGRVAGASVNSAGIGRAVLWSPEGQILDLGGLDDLGQSEALGLNNHGVAVGRAEARIGRLLISRATRFRVDPRTGAVSQEDLGALIPQGSSVARAINDLGQITGFSESAGGATHAVLFQDGGSPLDLHPSGLLGSSLGLAINDSGLVVGELRANNQGSRAFLWSPTIGMVDLNTLIDPRLGWTLNSATGINDRGQIVGHGTFQGRTLAFRLDPIGPIVPEPPSLVPLGLGALILFACSVRGDARVSWRTTISARRRSLVRDVGRIFRGVGRTPG